MRPYLRALAEVALPALVAAFLMAVIVVFGGHLALSLLGR